MGGQGCCPAGQHLGASGPPGPRLPLAELRCSPSPVRGGGGAWPGGEASDPARPAVPLPVPTSDSFLTKPLPSWVHPLTTCSRGAQAPLSQPGAAVSTAVFLGARRGGGV